MSDNFDNGGENEVPDDLTDDIQEQIDEAVDDRISDLYDHTPAPRSSGCLFILALPALALWMLR
jgi:hypothetical protein